MDRMIYVSMAGAKASMQRQDTLANNLANVSNNGFRAELQAFRAVPVQGSGASTRAYALETTTGYNPEPGAIMGTGRNLAFYDRCRVTRLVGVDPAMQMHRLAQKRSQKAGIAVELMGLSAEQLPTPDASFDTVVCTYTLCSIPDAAQALREIKVQP